MTASAYPLFLDRGFKPDKDSAGVALETDRAAVEYNGFKFPPLLKATAQIEPVMDDSVRVTKYDRITIKISCYIFHGLNLGTSGTVAAPSVSTALFGGAYNYVSNIPAAADNGLTKAQYSTDLEMDNLYARLMEPCQNLRFISQGLGTINVGQQNSGGSPLDATLDVDNGPKPQVTTWRPLGPKCCYVEWQVVTCLSPCKSENRDFAQLPFTVDYNISRSGLTVRTIAGDLEIALTRIPDNTSHHALGSDTFYLSNSRGLINSYFPLLPGWHRTQKYLLSNDRKHVRFSITDTEIDSDEAFGEGCANEEVTLDTNNKFPMVFSIWDVSLSGSIELAAGYPKRYALAEISRLFNRYYTVCAYQGDFITRTSSGPSTEGSDEADDDKGAAQTSLAKVEGGSYPILQSIHFTDHLFARKVDFSIHWSLYTTLQTLFAATGMFVPARNYVPFDPANPDASNAGAYFANPETAQRNAWSLWKTSLGIFLDNGGFQGLDFSDSDDIIMSLCQDPIGGENVPQDLNIEFDPIGSDDNERDTEERVHKNSWHTFEPRFHIRREEHAAAHAPLSDFTPLRETPNNPEVAREFEEFDPTGGNTYGDPAAADTLVHARRQPSYLLEFSGYAIRLNLPVPEPNVEFYGTRPQLDADGNVDPDAPQLPIPVTRVGTSTLKPQMLGVGTDLITGKSYRIYGLMWHKTYSLPTAPLSSKIVSDAHKDIFIG